MTELTHVHKERVRLWVDALRSGEYSQARNRLYDPTNGGYCCLGVATEVCLKNHEGHFDPLTVLTVAESINSAYLPRDEVSEWYEFFLPDDDDGSVTNDPSVKTYLAPDAPKDTSEEFTGVPLERWLIPHPASEDAEPFWAQVSNLNDYGDWTFDMIADALERTYLADETELG